MKRGIRIFRKPNPKPDSDRDKKVPNKIVRRGNCCGGKK